MSTQNGQSIGPEGTPAKASVDARNASQFSKPQREFLEAVRFQGTDHLAESLRLIHDLALYYSDVPIEEREKEALYEVSLGRPGGDGESTVNLRGGLRVVRLSGFLRLKQVSIHPRDARGYST